MDRKTRTLLFCGALAGPLFTIAWLIEGLARVHYDPTRHPISSLSLGEWGWTQIANFLVTGILTLVLASGLRKVFQSEGEAVWVPILIAGVGVGFLGTGFFNTDPISGYPLGTPAIRFPPTLTGVLHIFFASFVFGLPLACFVMARLFDDQGGRNWAVYSKFTAVTFILVYLFAMAGFLQVPGLVNYAGVLQRISLTIILLWMTLLPIYLLKYPLPLQATGKS
ncbi:MAG TPA: DUF998 domain-containing protein [Anaerolineales bacterium]|jgi:hypothetical protein|nr:DUF998 domain-containing protein [Anaerolineales bacterium]